MPDILIIGGGFAGVWSAIAAVRLCRQSGEDLAISLVTPGDDLVIRPRLYESDPGAMRVRLDRILDPIGVDRLYATATAIDPARRSVTVIDHGRNRELSYQRLILATGSTLRRPDLPGGEYLYDVDTLTGAVALDTHLRGLPSKPVSPGRFTAVVVGAGFTGLEVATELAGRLHEIAEPAAAEGRVILLERADTIGPELGAGPRPAIAAALRELGIETRLNTSLAAVDAAHARLTDETEINAHTVIWTAGMAASELTGHIPGQHDDLGRLLVDRHLRVPEAPEIFVAGDTAAADTGSGQLTLQSCQYAVPLGKYAGNNAAADLLDQSPVEFSPEPYATCLDLGAAGAVLTTGRERTVKLTGKAAKDLKSRINQKRIYPPLDDADTILAAGALERTWADIA